MLPLQWTRANGLAAKRAGVDGALALRAGGTGSGDSIGAVDEIAGIKAKAVAFTGVIA